MGLVLVRNPESFSNLLEVGARTCE